MAHDQKNARAWAEWAVKNPSAVCRDNKGEWAGECVTLGKHFLNGMTSVPYPFASRGNGKDVASILISRGEAKKISKPQAGAIISYPATPSNQWGHDVVAISQNELVEQSSGYSPNNGRHTCGRYAPRIGAIRAGYTTIALPNGYYEDGGTPAPQPNPPSGVEVLGPAAPPATITKGDKVAALSAGMRRVFPAYTPRAALGPVYGPNLTKSVKEFQRRTGLTQDGYVGPITKAKLAEYGVKF